MVRHRREPGQLHEANGPPSPVGGALIRAVLRVGDGAAPGRLGGVASGTNAARAREAKRSDPDASETEELTIVGADSLAWPGWPSPSGDRPDAAPDVASLLVSARGRGFRRIGLYTDARRLSQGRGASDLRSLGLTDLLVPLLGPTAGCHDYHAGSPGRFAATIAGIDAARAAGLEIAVVTVVTRSNFRALLPLASLLRRRSVSGWLLTLPRDLPRSDDRFPRLVPRLSLALPYALHAVDRARAAGLPAWLRSAPLCRLGRLAARALEAKPQSYGRACAGCVARDGCPGVASSYLHRYGDGELRALDEAPAGPDEEPRSIARMLAVDGCDDRLEEQC